MRGVYYIRPETKRTLCVYRYTDAEDGIIKYVGIVKNGSLYNRILAHQETDEWCRGKHWIVEYFECDSISEVEAFESHLISLYGTDKYYNIKKAGWGTNKYLPDIEGRWESAQDGIYTNYEVMKAATFFRWLVRERMMKEAKEVYNCFVFTE